MGDSGRSFENLVAIMDALRERCPWDREQTFSTLKACLLEETYEVLEALSAPGHEGLTEELGDLLLQVVFLARLAREQGLCDLGGIITSLCEKMVRRHPHVFGQVEARDAQQVLINWAKIKEAEADEREGAREAYSALDGVPGSLPALLRARRLTEKASRVGFDWPSAREVWTKVQEELEELRAGIESADRARIGEELGDLLLTLVNLSRLVAVDPEDALQQATRKFERRFRTMEEHFRAQNRHLRDATLAEMDAVWDAVKADGG